MFCLFYPFTIVKYGFLPVPTYLKNNNLPETCKQKPQEAQRQQKSQQKQEQEQEQELIRVSFLSLALFPDQFSKSLVPLYCGLFLDTKIL